MPKALKQAFTLLLILTCVGLNAEPVHTVKFYKYGSKILFNAIILDSNEITVLFDPGTYAYMHTGTTQKYKIEYSETGQMTSIDNVSAINMFSNFKVAFNGFEEEFKTIRAQATAPYLNKRIDMVFGKEWADMYIIEIDYETSEIRLYNDKSFVVPEGYKPLETINWHHYPMVKSWFVFDNGDSAEFNVELNIGSEVGFQLDKWATKEYKLKKIQKDRGSMRVFGSDGRGLEGMLTRTKSVQIGDMRKSMVRGAVFEDGYSKGNGEFVHGIVGQEFLQWYCIILDRWDQKVYYKTAKRE